MDRMSRLLVAAVLILIAVPELLLCPQAQAATEQASSFDSLQVDINILSNSDMEITETQKYSFFDGVFRYGYRWILLDGVDSIDEIQVYEDGIPYVLEPAVRRWIEDCEKTGKAVSGNYSTYYTWTEGD